MPDPAVSVIIPNVNMAAFIHEAIGSVLEQDVAVSEIIVIDAESDDSSISVVEEIRLRGAPIRLLRRERAPPAVIRNYGLQASAGDIVGFLDADDIWPRGKLQRQLRRLAELPQIDVVSGLVAYLHDADRAAAAPVAGPPLSQTLVHLGACLFRASVFDAVGVFDPELTYAEDVDFALRIRERHLPVEILPSVELYYRRHGSSMTSDPGARKHHDFRLALQKSIRRRRTPNGTTSRLAPLLRQSPGMDDI